MENVLFYVFAAVVLVSAILVVTMKNLVRSIFLFFVTLFSLAGLYIFALADFIAVTQVVIYAGGVLVLMLFAFMLSNRELLDGMELKNTGFRINHLSGMLVAGGFLFIIIVAVAVADVDHLAWVKQSVSLTADDNTIHGIGIQTMTTYLLPFEVVSIFLLMSLIGAAHLARKEKKT